MLNFLVVGELLFVSDFLYLFSFFKGEIKKRK